MNDRRPGLNPPRFRLATLMWLIALLCALFAMMSTVGPYGTIALVLFVLAVFAHVAGNAIGTCLRDNGDRPIQTDGTPMKRLAREARVLSQDDYAPATRLGQRSSLGRTVAASTAAGILLGGGGGGALLIAVNWQRITGPTTIFAVLFSAILGGLAGFLTSSFIYVLIGAQLEALRHAKRR